MNMEFEVQMYKKVSVAENLISIMYPFYLICVYEQTKAVHRVAAFWRVYSRGREIRYRFVQNQNVVHLHFFSYNGLSFDRVYDTCFLDEHQTVYLVC
jgi:hypothetical protein